LFTGLVETIGAVRAVRKSAVAHRLTIETCFERLALGESISVEGVCQTVARVEGACFSCDVLRETLRVSTLGSLRPGSPVNLERALAVGARVGGHFMNGHVDGLGTVTKVRRKPPALEIALDEPLLRYVVPKGSIAVNGVSLTVAPEVRRSRFSVLIIPHTWGHTTLKSLRAGSKVNIEVDIVAKYVEHYIASRKGSEEA
jgi:riboflavin synthase